jgi:7-keto-8-aminopelargonate synthetase-like enzyme
MLWYQGLLQHCFTWYWVFFFESVLLISIKMKRTKSSAGKPKESDEYLISSKLGTKTRLNQKDYLYFGGAGYFLLQSHPEVIEAAVKATLEFGTGSANSQTLTGTTPFLLRLEAKIAEFFKTEDVAYLPSGYLTNMAGFQALSALEFVDIIFIDEFAHYCNSDATMLTGKPTIQFKHRDPEDLVMKIRQYCTHGQKTLIASDGLFPIKADIAPVDEYLKIANEHKGIVWIDDSHGVGIIGDKGLGTYEHHKLESDKLYMGATLSKAFGAYGGFITGKKGFIAAVKTGNVMKGSSSPPYAMVAAATKGLELLSQNPGWRSKLWENAQYLKSGLRKTGIRISQDHIPIACFETGNA